MFLYSCCLFIIDKKTNIYVQKISAMVPVFTTVPEHPALCMLRHDQDVKCL